MLTLHCSDLWVRLAQLARGSKQCKAAVAYVSNNERIRFRKGDILVVDASETAISTGQTSAKVLNQAFESGAQIFTCPNLHAKVYVFDATVVIGSANLSTSSAERLLEAAVISDAPSLVSAARNLIKNLQQASTRLQAAEIEKLQHIPVVRKFPIRGIAHRALKINPTPGLTWLAATHDLDMKRYAKEERRAEAGRKQAEKRLAKKSSEANWIRFSKNSNVALKASINDWMIEMRRPKTTSGSARVYRACPIRYIQHEPNCARVYLEEFKTSESKAIGWRTFQRIAREAGIRSTRLGARSVGVLTASEADLLDSLWKAQLKTSRK